MVIALSGKQMVGRAYRTIGLSFQLYLPNKSEKIRPLSFLFASAKQNEKKYSLSGKQLIKNSILHGDVLCYKLNKRCDPALFKNIMLDPDKES